MSKFIDKEGNLHTLDKANNHFINGKVVNPKSYENKEIGETIEDYEVEPVLLVTGHVSKFEYGYGIDKVVVDTGKKS